MFKFDFISEDMKDDIVDSNSRGSNVKEETFPQNEPPPLVTYQVEDLIKILPQLISYSPLRIPLSNHQSLTLLRRDLFDARFQLITESTTVETSDDLNFIDFPSDIVPGVYEGGLKTWECSTDLAGYLEGVADCTHRRVLEVGCGTAVPSLSLLHKIFHMNRAKGFNKHSGLTLHMQDYNSMVLQLVTMPNIVLTWWLKADSSGLLPFHSSPDASPASATFRFNQDPPLPEINVSEPGELPLTAELLSAFLESLKEHNIDITCISGTWSDMDAWIRNRQQPYDLILTSETIYHPSSLQSLVSLLRSSFILCRNISLEDEAQDPYNELANPSLPNTFRAAPRLCLVAAKVVYFGVGGGIHGFEKAIEETQGETRTVYEQKAGVSRRIMQVTWSEDHSDLG